MLDLFDAPQPEPAVLPVRSKGVVLRDYQRAAVDAIFEAWKECTSTLVVMPTGTGKTTVFSEVVRRSPGRWLILAHREELIFQAGQRLASVGIETEIEMGDLRAAEWQKPRAIVSTVQTQSGRMKKFDPFEFDGVIVDEGHHGTGPSYRKVIAYYCQNPKTKVLYVTATPDRADEEALGQICDTVAYNYEVLDAIHDGWLVPVLQQSVAVEDMDFSRVRSTAGDLNGADLAAVMEAEGSLHGVASATLDIAGDKQTIVFTASVKQAEMLAEIFNRHRSGMADWVCGDTPKDQRRETLKRFSHKAYQIIVNCGVLTEGYDEAGIEVVVQARPTKSRSLYAQIIGRGTRPLPGTVDGLATAEERRASIAASSKPHILVIDFAGNAGKHKLVTTADVLGGKCTPEVIAAAAAKAKSAGKPMRMDEALEEAQQQAEEKRQREAARKAKLVASASYKTAAVDPFDVFHLTPATARGWDRTKKLSQPMRNVLASNGFNPEKLTFTQGKQLIAEIFRRRTEGLCTPKQALMLQKYGYDPAKISFAQAGTLINAIVANGWKRPE